MLVVAVVGFVKHKGANGIRIFVFAVHCLLNCCGSLRSSAAQALIGKS